MIRDTTCRKCNQQTRYEADTGKNKCTHCGTKFWATSGHDGKWFSVEIWNEKDLREIELDVSLFLEIGRKENFEEIFAYLTNEWFERYGYSPLGYSRLNKKQENVLNSIWSDRDSKEAALITNALIVALKKSNSEIVQAMNTAQKKRLENIHIRYLLHAESVDNEWEKDMRWLVGMLRELHIEFRESDDSKTY